VVARRQSQRRLIAARNHHRGCAVEPNVLRPQCRVARQEGILIGGSGGLAERGVLAEVELEPVAKRQRRRVTRAGPHGVGVVDVVQRPVDPGRSGGERRLRERLGARDG
jgi:hypothetical protein